MHDKPTALQKIRTIANYQFGKGTGKKLFPNNVQITHSRKTGKIRHIYLNKKLLTTLRPTTGLFALTITGAKQITKNMKPQRLWIKIEKEAEPFVTKGKSAFAKHVTDADEEIRPQEEVIIINKNNKILAVGKALLTGKEMKTFKKGVAVQVRKGTAEEVKKETKTV
ncbi:MAG: pseudouridine synthase [Candidatus Bathyarchaeota archaeon]|nr:MAG: pseudouridine synthase [Candidatus Bathyarchaeota archaeon]